MLLLSLPSPAVYLHLRLPRSQVTFHVLGRSKCPVQCLTISWLQPLLYELERLGLEVRAIMGKHKHYAKSRTDTSFGIRRPLYRPRNSGIYIGSS
jgi:hypothetical protein